MAAPRSASPHGRPGAPGGFGIQYGRTAREGYALSDHVLRATTADGTLRALAIRCTEAVREAARRHGTWPTATAALGRCLGGAGLLAAMLKPGQSVTLRIRGDGPLGGVVADGRATPDGGIAVRGYVKEPRVDLPLNALGKLDVGGAVGKGLIHVTRDLGLGEPYTGTAPLASGEIAEDLTGYFAHSEQIPSAVSLGVLVGPDGGVRAAGGLLLQLLPGAPAGWAARLEANLAGLTGISWRIEAGAAPADLLAEALGGFQVETFPPQPVHFACGCSRERLAGTLRRLGSATIAELLEEDGGAELTCHFCGDRHAFDAEALGRILLEARAGEGRRRDSEEA